jgi:FdhE protein
LAPEAVHRVFQSVAGARPAYAAVLPFFESVCVLQETAAATAQPEPIRLEPDILEAKLKGGLPLMERSRMPVDWAGACKLLGAIREAAEPANPVLMQAAGALGRHLEPSDEVLREAVAALLADDPERLQAAAGGLQVDARVLPFFLHSGLWPSIAAHACRLREHLKDLEAGTTGYCPLCGASPFLSVLGEQGQRELVCSFCRHRWPVIRIFCPFCGNTDNASISYFFSEEEKEYRVHTCQRCKAYIKTVDARVLNRVCYPPLEAVATAHLDIKAGSLGFVDQAPPWIGV